LLIYLQYAGKLTLIFILETKIVTIKVNIFAYPRLQCQLLLLRLGKVHVGHILTMSSYNSLNM